MFPDVRTACRSGSTASGGDADMQAAVAAASCTSDVFAYFPEVWDYCAVSG
jgi:hypothetical protein